MRPVLFDSSVYVAALRSGPNAAVARIRRAENAPVWLSSVVLLELYAGSGPGDRRAVERLERDFDRLRRILVPNLTDWTQAGKVLRQIATKYGYERIGQGRLTNDALIAMSAARRGITVVTANEKDFAKLAEIRPFFWELQQPIP